MMKVCLIFVIAALVSASGQFLPTDVVETAKGPVQGIIQKTIWNSHEYSAFKGIPYAHPPTGYLRFKPPEPVKPWTKTLNASREASNCVQMDFLTENLSGNEDCLYLNVYTPWTKFNDERKDLKAVMVWFYGGSFKAGYSKSILYGEDFLLEEDVVLVTFNYRVGPLGFLSLQHQNASGNAGLKDQNLVLRWVQENIRKFGGDPDNVTIFGQSAGAVSVDFQVLSDMSRGLFHRSIAMSGSVLCYWAFHTPEVAVDRAFKLGRKLGFDGKRVEDFLPFLYNASAEDLVKAAEELTMVDLEFKPTLEPTNMGPKNKPFMTECSVNRYKRGDFSKLPHLMGYTANEALGFASSVDQLQKLVDYLLSIIDGFGALSMLKPPGSLNWLTAGIDFSKGISSDLLMKIVDTASDLLFVAPIDLKQKVLYANSPAPLFYYRLSYDSEYAYHRVQLNITSLNGTAHGDDIQYIFNTEATNVPTDKHHPLSIFRRKMVRLWANFAKYSNPTPVGKEDPVLGVTWPTSGRLGKQLDIDEQLTVSNRLASVWAQFYQLGVKSTAPAVAGCKKTSLLDKMVGLFG